jgi:phage recombination protein Bet
MTASSAIATTEKQSLITSMAIRYGLEPGKFYTTLEKTILPAGKQASQEQVAAFLVVANHYQLNPFIKEIYAFPAQGGGITPIVSVDGWLTLINRQPNLDGIEYQDHIDDTHGLTAITCRIYRKDRSRPTEITEYMKECKRKTSTWDQWPARMLRHKALIQCARQAFGLAGIYDPDEAERIAENGNGGNHQPMAEKTKAKIDEIKQRFTPEPDAATETEPIEAIDAEFVTDEPTVAAEETDDLADLNPEPEDADPLESLRADVQAALDELPKPAQKNLLQGRPFVKDMGSDDLQQMLIDIRKVAE